MTLGSSTRIDLPAAGVHHVDTARSTLTFTGRHLFGLGTVRGTFDISEARVVVADPVTDSTVTAVVDPASFRSGHARRDQDVVSRRYLDVAAHPTIRFTSTGLRPDGDRWVLTGTVGAHGRDVPVELVVDRAEQAGGVVRVHARAEGLDRHAWGVTGGRGLVGRHFALDLDLALEGAGRG
ncbi:YceI family protein [Modestobacter sp. NPDC049651]|uniref:YceI family protein n=1 Tax=unclassified Modestobacter TaxID=2643866 RepID=UPI0033D9546C